MPHPRPPPPPPPPLSHSVQTRPSLTIRLIDHTSQTLLAHQPDALVLPRARLPPALLWSDAAHQRPICASLRTPIRLRCTATLPPLMQIGVYFDNSVSAFWGEFNGRTLEEVNQYLNRTKGAYQHTFTLYVRNEYYLISGVAGLIELHWATEVYGYLNEGTFPLTFTDVLVLRHWSATQIRHSTTRQNSDVLVSSDGVDCDVLICHPAAHWKYDACVRPRLQAAPPWLRFYLQPWPSVRPDPLFGLDETTDEEITQYEPQPVPPAILQARKKKQCQRAWPEHYATEFKTRAAQADPGIALRWLTPHPDMLDQPAPSAAVSPAFTTIPLH